MLGNSDAVYLVIALFKDRASGSMVARALTRRQDTALGGRHVGLLTLEPGAGVERSRLGPGTGSRGLEVGAVLCVIADAIDGGVLPRRQHFLDKDSELLTDDVARLGAELEGGGSAVALLAGVAECENAIIAFAELGGRTEVHRISVAATDMLSANPTERRS